MKDRWARLPWQMSARAGAAIGGPCAVCRLWSGQALCQRCLDSHRGTRWRCSRCALPLASTGSCPECLQALPPFDRARVAFDYAFPWDGLIADLKFHGRTELARPLAAALADAVQSDGGADAVKLLVPVPLAPARLAERGFNQSALLAQHLADRLARPCALSGLQRPVETAHQATLSRRERAQNLRGAFMFDPGQRAQLAGRRVALIDDVMTTGATAREAARELLRAGAGAVEIWAIARTP